MNEFKDLKNKILGKGWIESTAPGNAAVGITLENLLGKEKENFEIPDYNGIEIKAKCSKKENNITLFSSVPDSYLFEIKRLVNLYGYHNNNYPNHKVLNVGVNAKSMTYIQSRNYFKLFVDYDLKQVILNVYNINGEFVENKTRWSFDILKEKLERKLKKMAFVEAERKWCPFKRKVYFKYYSVTLYTLKSFETFIDLINNGTISISFNISVYRDKRRLGKVYDHGTTFRISKYDLEKLFNKIE